MTHPNNLQINFKSALQWNLNSNALFDLMEIVMKKNFMFICLGNICRSPMAEFIFKDMLKNAAVDGDFVVASCATSAEEIIGGVGNPMYHLAQNELIKNGIPFGDKRAVQLKKSDYSKYDLFLCMDESNRRNTLRIFGSDPDNKVKKLLDYTDRKGDVSDPWFTRKFDVAYKDIFDGCKGLLKVEVLGGDNG